MINNLARFLLVATSLAPILGAVAINQYSQGKSWQDWSVWLVAGVLLVFICWGVLEYSAKAIQKQQLTIEEFDTEDREVLAFPVAYLLPLLSSKDLSFSGDWMTGAYVLVIIFWVITHSGAFHFNPVMGLVGYHFYRVKNSQGLPVVIISKREITMRGTQLNIVKLSRNIYLDTEKQG